MIYFYIGVGIIAIGLGLVVWLLWSEKKEKANSLPSKTEPKRAGDHQESPENVLSRLGLGAQTGTSEGKKSKNPLDFLKNFNPLKKKEPSVQPISNPFQNANPSAFTGTASVKVAQDSSSFDNIPPEDDNLTKLSDLQIKTTELKSKCAKLEEILKEKSESFERMEKELVHEQKNRKEFNKVKDILEKDIKDRKDQIQAIEIKLSEAQTEVNSNVKRMSQMDEKITTLEKDLLGKENEIKDLQASVQLEKKRLAEMETKFKEKDAIIQEKEKKIEDLIKKMHELDSVNQAKGSPPPESPETARADQGPPPVQTKNKEEGGATPSAGIPASVPKDSTVKSPSETPIPEPEPQKSSEKPSAEPPREPKIEKPKEDAQSQKEKPLPEPQERSEMPPIESQEKSETQATPTDEDRLKLPPDIRKKPDNLNQDNLENQSIDNKSNKKNTENKADENKFQEKPSNSSSDTKPKTPPENTENTKSP